MLTEQALEPATPVYGRVAVSGLIFF